jgi:hypothetical protein
MDKPRVLRTPTEQTAEGVASQESPGVRDLGRWWRVKRDTCVEMTHENTQ